MAFTGQDVHLNVPLSNVAIAYKPTGFIAGQIAPIVTVPKQSDAYYVWSQADAFRIEDTKRAPKTEANVVERNVSSDTFYCENYAIKDRLAYEDIENADASFIFARREARTQYLKDKLYLDWERRVTLMCTSYSNVSSYLNVDSVWTVYATGKSHPEERIWTVMDVIKDTT